MKLVTLGELPCDRSSAVSDSVATFLRAAHSLLVSSGWRCERKAIRSAMYNWDYTRSGHTLVLCGWHGTGKPGTCRWFGDTKTFFGLHHHEPGAKACAAQKVDLDILQEGTPDEIVATQAAAIAQANAYLAKL